MKTKQKKPECANPKCRSRRTYKAFDNPADKTWRCHDCPAEFEPDDEGGDYSDYDPSWRIQREERKRRA